MGVAYTTAGFILLWSGYKNATIKDTLTSFLKGKPPTASPTGSVTIGLGGSGTAAPANTDGNANIPSTVGMPTARGTYSKTQLETLWVLAGGNPALANTMARIALAESGGNVDAHNASGASGLWQIMVPSNNWAIPGGASNVYNAMDNARAAVAIYKAQGLHAWSTYTSGAYLSEP